MQNKSLVSKLNLQPHISAPSKPAVQSQIHRLVNMIHLHNLLKIIQLIRCQQKDSLTSTDSSHKWHNAE